MKLHAQPIMNHMIMNYRVISNEKLYQTKEDIYLGIYQLARYLDFADFLIHILTSGSENVIQGYQS